MLLLERYVNLVHAPFYANGSSIIQIDFGYLSGCVQVPDGEFTSVCIVQVLQPMDSFGIQLTDEFECSLFQQTSLFRCVSSQCIRTSVSFCHQCTSSCKFVRKSTTASFERETLQVQKLVLQHDFNSDMYCLNVYSIIS